MTKLPEAAAIIVMELLSTTLELNSPLNAGCLVFCDTVLQMSFFYLLGFSSLKHCLVCMVVVVLHLCVVGGVKCMNQYSFRNSILFKRP